MLPCFDSLAAYFPNVCFLFRHCCRDSQICTDLALNELLGEVQLVQNGTRARYAATFVVAFAYHTEQQSSPNTLQPDLLELSPCLGTISKSLAERLVMK